ncbi:VOC family protein [Actinacidiphila acidipaludis]|uniref:VOC family protein n=1 Tax=Actinacidiphila acidipaludis TaxID=2873382 RepID=UPI0027DF7B03|nr:VOC family protein [Streptomyces acidipaludis]
MARETAGGTPEPTGLTRLSGFALECRDPAALAAFYSALTGWPVVHASPDWYSLGPDADTDFHLSFQRAPGHRPPLWPDPASSMQAHLHLRADDLDAAQDRALALGATLCPDQEDLSGSRVLTDPAGHPFCLCPAPRGRAHREQS